MRLLGWLSARNIRRRIAEDKSVRAELRQRLEIHADTPVCTYDRALRSRVQEAAGQDSLAAIVRTSGTTSEPKELLYTPRRLRKLKKAFALATARIVCARGVRRPIIFTLASPKEDDSLTSLYAWQHGRMPARIDCLVTPHMILSHPEMVRQTERYGLCAVRLWAITLSNPGWLYSTNPSTQSLFLRQLEADWEGARAMTRDWLSGELESPVLSSLARQIVASGWTARMQACLAADSPWPVHSWWPALEIRSSWDGGSVGSFLSDIARYLPDRVQFMPMFSMSTESIETLPVFEGTRACFLPLAPGVLVEFLPEEAADDPAFLVEAQELQEGAFYCLVLSDAYGLRRYQSEDVFECRGQLGGLPDLAFRRRRGLAWSFTGEKLTGTQLEQVFVRLRQEADLGGDLALSCIPSDPGEGAMPGYVLLMAYTADAPLLVPDLVPRFDALLAEINTEYGDKRSSGRLALPRQAALSYDGIAAALDPRARGEGAESQRAWDSQFKLLPLLCRTWEELDLSA
jgi:hypothetical protein